MQQTQLAPMARQEREDISPPWPIKIWKVASSMRMQTQHQQDLRSVEASTRYVHLCCCSPRLSHPILLNWCSVLLPIVLLESPYPLLSCWLGSFACLRFRTL